MATILTKRSNTASSVPVAGDLTNSSSGAELAVNTADKRLFTKDSGGTVVELGTNPSSLTLSGGTANGVAYLNGSKVLTSGSALTFDGTNFATTGRGTFGQRVQVTGNTAPSTGSGLELFFDGTVAAALAFARGTGYLPLGLDGSDIRFYASSSEQMRLTSTGLDVKGKLGVGYSDFSGLPTNGVAFAGSVGIGTSSPSYKLDVADTTVRARITSSTGTNSAFYQAVNTGGSAYIGLDNSSGSLTGSTGAAYSLNFMHTGAYPIIFSTNGTERARIDSSGNLGLGVTPNTWTSGYKAFEIGASGSAVWSNGSSNIVLGQGFYANSGNKYAQSSYAVGGYQINAGVHSWLIAGAGTAGNAISFTQAMTLDASGNLGVGTTSPNKWPINKTITVNAASGNYGGFELAVADTLTAAFIGTTTETRIAAKGASNPITFEVNGNERARIDSSGNLLIAATSPPSGCNAAVAIGAASVSTRQTGVFWNGRYSTSAGLPHLSGNWASSAWWGIGPHSGTADNIVRIGQTTADGSGYYWNGTYCNVYAGAYTNASDYRIKENVVNMAGGALEKVLALRPVNYTMIQAIDPEVEPAPVKTEIGFIAHEIQQHIPEIVVGEKDAVQDDGTPLHQGVDYSKMTVVLVKAIQEQQAIITALTARVAALESN